MSSVFKRCKGYVDVFSITLVLIILALLLTLAAQLQAAQLEGHAKHVKIVVS